MTKGHAIKKDGVIRFNEQLNFDADNYFSSHLIVSAPDLAKWNECLHNGKLLKPATYKMMASYSITNAHNLLAKNLLVMGMD